MTELPDKIAFPQLRSKLEAAGFNEIKQLGNHAKFVRRKGDEIRTAIFPHYKELTKNTIRSILNQAGISTDEFHLL